MKSEEYKADELARKKIAEGIFENFFVEAGAGSGKTTSLVTRMVNMVKAGIPVEKISAITYTKAAANEFYERFEKALAQDDDDLCVKALKDIDLAFMGTIDSFCNTVISEHPSFVGVPSNVTNRTKEEMELIYRNEFSRIRGGEYGEGLRELCSNYIDFNDHAEDNFVTILNALMDKRNMDYVYEEVNYETIRQVIVKETLATFGVLKELSKRPQIIDEGSDKARKAKEEFLKRANMLDRPVKDMPSLMAFFKSFKDLRLYPDTILSSLGTYAATVFAEHLTRGKPAWYEIGRAHV